MRTRNGRAVSLTSIDLVSGFVYGFVAGFCQPITWGFPDGDCLNYPMHYQPEGYNLDMETFPCS